MWSSRRRPYRQIGRELDARRRQESDVDIRVYVRPVGRDGLHVVRRACSTEEITVTGSSRTHAPGSAVPVGRRSGAPREFLLTTPPPGYVGTSALPVDRRSRALDVLAIFSADPSTVEAGTTTAVTLSGIGFGENPLDQLQAVRWDGAMWATDPLVTVGTVTWVSAEELTADITVDAAAPEDYPISLEITRS